MAAEIKVLVVDDSAFMRKVLCDILNEDKSIHVIDTARNGKEAVEKALRLSPDVITMDIEMPVMDGLSCLKELLRIRYFPVIMLSSLTSKGTKATIEALENGAIDFITKPSNIFEMTGRTLIRELLEKIKMAKNSVPPGKAIVRDLKEKPKIAAAKDNSIKCIVAIGTSTGGPKSLQEVIPLIPGNIPAAFLVVQHMPPGFTRSLAERLNSMSELTVKEAEDGDEIKAGYAYIAPGDYHMVVSKAEHDIIKIGLNREKPVGGHRPSVNVMMNSLSDTGLSNLIGVIMTGMGADGSEGISNIKSKNNGYIIAQDEKTCVVYGMPRAAVQTGAVDTVVPLDEIAEQITKIVGVFK